MSKSSSLGKVGCIRVMFVMFLSSNDQIFWPDPEGLLAASVSLPWSLTYSLFYTGCII